MAVVKKPLSRAKIKLFAGVVDYYEFNGQHVIRKWPDYSQTKLTAGTKAAAAAMAQSRKDLQLVDGRLKAIWREKLIGRRMAWLDAWTARYMRAWKVCKGLPPVITKLEKKTTATTIELYATIMRETDYTLQVHDGIHLEKKKPKQDRGQRERCPTIIPGPRIYIRRRPAPTYRDVIITRDPNIAVSHRWTLLPGANVSAAMDEYIAMRSSIPWAPMDPEIYDQALLRSQYADFGTYVELTVEEWRCTAKLNTQEWYEEWTDRPDYLKMTFRNEYEQDASALAIEPWDIREESLKKGTHSYQFPIDSHLRLDDGVVTDFYPPDNIPAFGPGLAELDYGYSNIMTSSWTLQKEIKNPVIIPDEEITDLPAPWIKFIIEGAEEDGYDVVFIDTPLHLIPEKP